MSGNHPLNTKWYRMWRTRHPHISSIHGESSHSHHLTPLLSNGDSQGKRYKNNFCWKSIALSTTFFWHTNTIAPFPRKMRKTIFFDPYPWIKLAIDVGLLEIFCTLFVIVYLRPIPTFSSMVIITNLNVYDWLDL